MERRSRTSRLTAGISLIESTISVFLALTCGFLLVAMIPMATLSKERAKAQNIATSLAPKHMEAVRSLGFSRITPQQLFDYGLIDNATSIDTDTYSITNVDAVLIDSPISSLPHGSGWLMIETVSINLKRVTVHIDYSDVKGDRFVHLETSIANY